MSHRYREFEGEGGAFVVAIRCTGDGAAHSLGHFEGNEEAKAGAGDVYRVGIVSPAELLEESVHSGLAHANAGVGDVDIDTLFL